MEKIAEFEEMLNDAKDQSFGYIGTGNLNSKILIIGKEVALDNDNAFLMNQYNDNQQQWERDFEKTLWDFPIRDLAVHSPLCPYRGQYFKIDNGRNWGTSRTWHNYQKLHNQIFGDSHGRINFHKNFFITELNSSPSPKTIHADVQSIVSRKAFIKNSKYFQSFPIVILGGVGYFDISENKNEIEQIFDVEFKTQKFANNNKSNPYWIHWNKDKTKLVINTRQLSMGVSNDLLVEIATLINDAQIDLEVKVSEKSNDYRWKLVGRENYEKLQNDEKFIETDEYKDYITWV